MEVATRFTQDRPLPLIVLVNCFFLFFFHLPYSCCSLNKYLFSHFPQVMFAWEMLFCSDRKFMKSNLSALVIFNQCFPSSPELFLYKLITHFTRFDKVTRHGKTLGNRTVAGRVVKESYGAAKQQHTFTVSLKFAAISYMKKSPVLLLGLLFGHT